MIDSFVVTAPGKCLITGGYLILDKDQRGLSVTVDAFTKATVVVESIPRSYSIVHINSLDLNSEWEYSINDSVLARQLSYSIQ